MHLYTVLQIKSVWEFMCNTGIILETLNGWKYRWILKQSFTWDNHNELPHKARFLQNSRHKELKLTVNYQNSHGKPSVFVFGNKLIQYTHIHKNFITYSHIHKYIYNPLQNLWYLVYFCMNKVQNIYQTQVLFW